MDQLIKGMVLSQQHPVELKLAFIKDLLGKYKMFDANLLILITTLLNEKNALAAQIMSMIMENQSLNASKLSDDKITPSLVGSFTTILQLPNLNVYLKYCICRTILSCSNNILFNALSPIIEKVGVLWVSTLKPFENYQSTYNVSYEQIANTYVTLLKTCWLMDPTHQRTLNSLRMLFLLTSNQKLTSTPALQAILHNAPIQANRMASVYITSPGIVDDGQLICAITRILKWPLSRNLMFWVLGLLTSLITARRYSVATHLIRSTLQNVLRQLYVEPFRDGAYVVLEFMLLGYQHDPQPFHSLIDEFIGLLKFLNKERITKAQTQSSQQTQQQQTQQQQQSRIESIIPENNAPVSIVRPALLKSLFSYMWFPLNANSDQPNIPAQISNPELTAEERSVDFLPRLSILLYTLMFLFSGYPSRYSSLLVLLQQLGCPAPSRADMMQMINTRKWIITVDSETEPTLQQKSTTGFVGLSNLGNTCYMNSLVQSLYFSGPLARLICATENTGPLVIALQETFAFLTMSNRKQFSPNCLLKTVPTYFSPGVQQDSSEYSKYLFDELEREWKGKKEEKLLSALFEGRLRYTTSCLKCSRQTITFDKFSEVPLSFPINQNANNDKNNNNSNASTTTTTTTTTSTSAATQAALSTIAKYQATTLDEMLSLFLNKEILSGNNQFYCENCQQLTDAERFVEFSQTPSHLIVALKRFAYDPALKARSKIMAPVSFPLEFTIPVLVQSDILSAKQLQQSQTITQQSQQTQTTQDPNVQPMDLDVAVASSSSTIPENNNSDSHEETQQQTLAQPQSQTQPIMMSQIPKHLQKTYVLYAVLVHSGMSPDFGHYYSFARPSDLASISSAASETSKPISDWVLLNDSNVERSSFEMISKLHSTFQWDTPYMLFYREKALTTESVDMNPNNNNNMNNHNSRQNNLVTQLMSSQNSMQDSSNSTVPLSPSQMLYQSTILEHNTNLSHANVSVEQLPFMLQRRVRDDNENMLKESENAILQKRTRVASAQSQPINKFVKRDNDDDNNNNGGYGGGGGGLMGQGPRVVF